MHEGPSGFFFVPEEQWQKRKNRPKAVFCFFAGSAPVTNGERRGPSGLFA
jgi:hypothetical protein